MIGGTALRASGFFRINHGDSRDMQNPFNNRPQDGHGRDERDDQRWEARDRRRDEGSSWSEGDGGRTAEAWRNQGRDDRQMSGSRGMGYGQNQQSRYDEGMSTGWTGDRARSAGVGAAAGAAWGSGQGQNYDRNSSHYSGQTDRSMDSGYSQGGGYGGSAMGGGYDQGQRRHASEGYSDHGYAPGSQIWEGQGRGMGGQSHQHHDFEPDYLHWRQQQLSAFDKDYTDWRDERRQKFSSDFDSWRQARPGSEASGQHKTPAENPIVGDVSDGGVGSQDAKKR